MAGRRLSLVFSPRTTARPLRPGCPLNKLIKKHEKESLNWSAATRWTLSTASCCARSPSFCYKAPSVCAIGSMTTIGHVFIPLDREHDGVVPTGEDRAHFESLPVPLALWQSFEECLSDHLSELSEGQIDRNEKFWFEAAHVNAMIAVVEAEAVAAAPELRDWLISLVAFARRAADR